MGVPKAKTVKGKYETKLEFQEGKGRGGNQTIKPMGKVWVLSGTTQYREVHVKRKILVMLSLSIFHIPTGVATLGDRIFVIGGNDGVSFLNSIECYDPHTNRWTQLAPMSRPRAGIGATALDGRIYAIGGFDGAQRLDIVEMYDPRMNVWSEVASLQSCRDGVCVMTYGCWVYAVGGIDGPSYLNTVEAYDPRTDQWEDVVAMTRCRAAAGVAVLKNSF